MNSTRKLLAGTVMIGLSLAAAPASADQQSEFRARLKGLNEVPAVSTQASGRFELELDRRTPLGKWKLRYEGLEGNVTVAHIHFGQRDVTGGVAVFLCSNLASPPAGTQACPAPPARIEGTFTAADVVGPMGQGISPGEFAELVRAIKQGATYANVHSDKFPTGEIRGQLRGDDDD